MCIIYTRNSLKNILAVIAGIIIGGAVNMGLIMISGSLIPPPEGVNPADMESLKANIHLFDANALQCLLAISFEQQFTYSPKIYSRIF